MFWDTEGHVVRVMSEKLLQPACQLLQTAANQCVVLLRSAYGVMCMHEHAPARTCSSTAKSNKAPK